MDSPTARRRAPLSSLLRSVVKVMTVSDSPDYDQPWQTNGVTSGSGSGVIVATERGPRVLTNGHCVEDHVFVEVLRYGDSRRYVAEVEALGDECDLALLRVDDDQFFGKLPPVAFGSLPQLSERVSVCGYPIGGERLSVTEGIVSRIDLVRYTHSQRRLLGVQIDAAINDGNSGGPVFRDDRLVGVVFQSLEDAEQIGYIIPTEVILHFLADADRGADGGFPELGVVWQPLESEAHRSALGLDPDRDRGVLVIDVAYESSAWGVLSCGDVLLEIDGVTVASDGTVPLRNAELIDFDYVVSRRRTGDTMTIKVWRQGRQVDCMVPLRPPQPLVPESGYGQRPSYFIVGGLLFVPLTRAYLRTWDDPWWSNAPEDLVALYEHGIRTPERTEAVVLQKVLADRTNQGYHDYESLLVSRVQGVKVRSLRHLVSVVERSTEEYLRFELSDGRRVVLRRDEARARNPLILERYGVPRDRSADLQRASEGTGHPGLSRVRRPRARRGRGRPASPAKR